MSKATNQTTQAKAAELRAAAARAERRRRTAIIGATAVGLLVVVGGVGWGLTHRTSAAGADTGTTASSAEFGARQTSAEMVAEAMRSLERTTAPSMVAGRRNRVLARLVRLVPRRTAIAVSDRVMGRARVRAGQAASHPAGSAA